MRETRALFARESDPERRWTSLGPILAELLADPAVVAASKTWPECRMVEGRIENLLFYEDPDYKFVINGLVLSDPAGGAGRVHDHGHIYTLYGCSTAISASSATNASTTAPSRIGPRFARRRDTACGPGEIDLVRPFEIHSEDSVGERAVAVIIRSELSGGFLQGRYELATNRYWQGFGPRQKPLAFFPN